MELCDGDDRGTGYGDADGYRSTNNFNNRCRHSAVNRKLSAIPNVAKNQRSRMGTKIEYVDTTHLYATKYIRNSKAIAVLWAIFTICYAIIGIVAFMTPEWIGDPDNEGAGRLGLWQSCQKDELFDSCGRHWESIFMVPTFSFQLATFFMAGAVILALLTICFLIFVIFMKSTKVFHVCGWMQIISALCMIVACVAFPFGWNSDDFRKICGPEANRFELGLCGIRWAYPLAIIGCIDGVILATLAFILATRHVRLQPDLYQNSLYKGESNNAYITDAVSLAGSRKSLNLQLLLVAPPNGEDTISQFSSRTPNHRYNRPEYHNQQF